MSEIDYINDYLQLGNSAPTNTHKPGDNVQLVDLNEFYDDTDQESVTHMVTGIEEMEKGLLSHRVIKHFNCGGNESLDPFPSSHNARIGGEGFFTSIYRGFETLLTNIIKYIKMAVNWVIDTVARVLGLRKSKRMDAEIEKGVLELREDFVNLIKGFGLPTEDFDVEAWVGTLPAGLKNGPQLKVLVSKIHDESYNIGKTADAIPLIHETLKLLKQASDRSIRAANDFKKVLSEEHVRTRIRVDKNMQIPVKDSTEVNRITKACLELRTSFEIGKIENNLLKIFETLYGIKFSNEELERSFNVVRERLSANVVMQAARIEGNNINKVLTNISYLNKRYMENKDNEISLRGVNWKAISSILDIADVKKIQEIANFYNYPNIIKDYQASAGAVKTFTEICDSISKELLKIENQSIAMIEWSTRLHTYFYAGVIDDFKTMKAVSDEARAKGLDPWTQFNGMPKKFTFMSEANAKTAFEHISTTVGEILTNDIGGFGSRLNKFTGQLGWGKIV